MVCGQDRGVLQLLRRAVCYSSFSSSMFDRIILIVLHKGKILSGSCQLKNTAGWIITNSKSGNPAAQRRRRSSSGFGKAAVLVLWSGLGTNDGTKASAAALNLRSEHSVAMAHRWSLTAKSFFFVFQKNQANSFIILPYGNICYLRTLISHRLNKRLTLFTQTYSILSVVA